MSLDLSLVSNGDWENVLTVDETAQYLNEPGYPAAAYFPIPKKFASVDKHVFLIGVASTIGVKPWWYLGGRVSQYLYISPSSSPDFSVGVQACQTQTLKINSMNLIQFQNFGVIPYVISIEIPYWLKDIHLEVWKYLGFEDNDPAATNNGDWNGGIYP